MKKKLLSALLCASFIFVSAPVYADEITDKIADIESRISQLENEVDELKTQLIGEPSEQANTSESQSEFSFTSEGHTFTYLKNEVGPNHEGKDRVIIYFDYTNNTGETYCPGFALSINAFQNGISLDSAGWLGSGITEEENFYKEIKDGTTLQVAIGFTLQDYSQINLEISPLFMTNDTEIGEYTFELSK